MVGIGIVLAVAFVALVVAFAVALVIAVIVVLIAQAGLYTFGELYLGFLALDEFTGHVCEPFLLRAVHELGDELGAFADQILDVSVVGETNDAALVQRLTDNGGEGQGFRAAGKAQVFDLTHLRGTAGEVGGVVHDNVSGRDGRQATEVLQANNRVAVVDLGADPGGYHDDDLAAADVLRGFQGDVAANAEDQVLGYGHQTALAVFLDADHRRRLDGQAVGAHVDGVLEGGVAVAGLTTGDSLTVVDLVVDRHERLELRQQTRILLRQGLLGQGEHVRSDAGGGVVQNVNVGQLHPAVEQREVGVGSAQGGVTPECQLFEVHGHTLGQRAHQVLFERGALDVVFQNFVGDANFRDHLFRGQGDLAEVRRRAVGLTNVTVVGAVVVGRTVLARGAQYTTVEAHAVDVDLGGAHADHTGLPDHGRLFEDEVDEAVRLLRQQNTARRGDLPDGQVGALFHEFVRFLGHMMSPAPFEAWKRSVCYIEDEAQLYFSAQVEKGIQQSRARVKADILTQASVYTVNAFIDRMIKAVKE